MKRRFVVLCQWTDSKDDHCFDADEIQVWAVCAEEAIREARKQWRLRVAAKWPSLRLEKLLILTPARLREIA